MKYVYELRNIEQGENELEKLNEWGEDGWEVVWFNRIKRRVVKHELTSSFTECYNYTECLLKREKQIGE